ncbi:Transglutaminase-like [Lasallia pustulata]|uniref:Transglutaminase-like n=1 Tax=Lasallia pustulata TaxID=136370 RepID=A0A1W5CZV3_9LECA|nr:Transglutaminase-like [Lasallia pustulata]
MADEPRSIQARIAALNLVQVNRGPSEAHAIVLGRPGLENRRQTVQNPPTSEPQPPSANGIGNEPNGTGSNGVLPPPVITRTGQNSPQESKTAGPPKMPPRRPSRSPALPPRRPSEQLSRRDSSESISPTLSSVSAGSIGPARTSTCRTPSMDGGRIRAPIYDPSTLPPLPPKRSPQEKEKEKARIPLKMTKSTLNVLPTQVLPPPSMPALPPRPAAKQLNGNTRKLPPEAPPPTPKRPGPSLNSNGSQIPRDTNEMTHGTTNGTSPSTGNASIVLATKPVAQASSSPASCLKCRDFSAPDGHAATFPRHAVPSLDWLASQLTTPFPSSTDKARAIFTWLHHNISYDVDAFFNNRVKPATPSSTLSSGLAVCEGYAGLFTALANKAGLESMVIGGHGKGFGFASLPPGVPIPAEHSNHAWNAVKIDAGEWKLIDCCWGAGNISGKGQPYNKDFTPKFFTMDNNEFGLRHFPTNRNHFFRTDGRFRLSWEEYIAGEQGEETVRTFNLVAQEGMDETKVLPKYLTIPIDASKHRAPTVRFQLEKVCAHWDPVRNGRGKPYVYVLQIHGRDGREKDFVPLDTNGMYWWVDVPPGMLGATGQTVTLYTVESVGGRDGRGLSVGDYREAKGRKAMGFGGVCAWELG